jgi:hypothetical protein
MSNPNPFDFQQGDPPPHHQPQWPPSDPDPLEPSRREAAATAKSLLGIIDPDWRRLPTCFSPWLLIPMFFLPWINLSCNGQTAVSQSGLQSCFGEVTVAKRFQELADQKGELAAPKNRKDEKPSPAYLIIPIPLLIVIGILTGLVCCGCVALRFRPVSAATHILCLATGSACFFLLLGQLIIGFPVMIRAKEGIAKMHEPLPPIQQQNKNPFFDDAAMKKAVGALVNVEAEYTAWFWLELAVAFLFLPFFVLEVLVSGYQVGRALIR